MCVFTQEINYKLYLNRITAAALLSVGFTCGLTLIDDFTAGVLPLTNDCGHNYIMSENVKPQPQLSVPCSSV